MQGKNPNQQRGGGSVPLPSDQDLARIIRGNTLEDAQLLVEKARALGRALHDKGLTTSQIRNIYGTVRQLEAQWPRGAPNPEAARELVLLKPKLAYQAARQPHKGVEELADVLGRAIDKVGADREHFGRFVDFFEAILAYHREAGGK
ncbi:MAG: type III-A CRISPR-associated protein Csm2 [Anaerolineae bacterium]